MKTSLIFKNILGSILLLAPSMLLAQGGNNFSGDREAMREKIFKELNLSDNQKEAMKEFRKKRAESREIWYDLKDLKTEMSLMLKKEATTEKEIRGKLKEVNQLMLKMNESKVENLLSLRKTLDAKQFKKLMRFIEAQRAMHKGQSGGPGGRFGGGHGQGQGGRFGGGPGGGQKGFGPRGGK